MVRAIAIEPSRYGDCLNRFARWSVVTYIVAVPLTSHIAGAVAPHDFARIGQLVIFLLCASCYALSNASGTRRVFGNPSHAWVGASLLILGALSVLLAPSIKHASRELALVMGLSCVVLVIATAESRIELLRMLHVAVSGAAAYCLLVLAIAIATVVNGAPIARTELFFGYDNYRFFNHVQTVCLTLLAMATTIRSGSRTATVIVWIGLVTGLALLMISGGRATSLGLLVGTVAALVVSWKDACRLATNLCVALMLGGLIFAALTPFLDLFGNTSPAGSSMAAPLTDDISNGRSYLWRLALQHIEKSPWFGIGPMHYAHYANTKAAHPHSVYLQLAAEWGVPMLVICLALAAVGLHQISRAIRSCVDQEQRRLGMGLLAACVAVMIDGALSGNFVMPISQMWIALLIGVSIAWIRSQRPPRMRQNKSSYRMALTASTAILMSQLWLVLSVLPEAIHLRDHLTQTSKNLSQSPRSAARLWSDGWF